MYFCHCRIAEPTVVPLCKARLLRLIISVLHLDIFISIYIFSLADTKIISCGEDGTCPSIFFQFDLFLQLTNMFKFSF